MRPRAFSLVEATIAMVIVGVMIAAALSSVGRTALARRLLTDQQVGRALAEQLMTEILSRSYTDPDYPTGSTIGPGNDEIGTGNRSRYDDVDDYNGWTESPPALANGTIIPDRANWQRSINVCYVRRTDLVTPYASDQGLKRITVTVQKAGREVACLVAIAGRGR